MIEIEKKCRISEDKAKELIQTLHKKTKFIKKIKKEDQYYITKEDCKKEINFSKPIFRIRKINEQYEVTFKQKILKDNAEINNEEEFAIDDIKAFKNFIKYIGFIKFVEKIKEIYLFRYKNLSIEIAHLHKLGHFIEIERMLENEQNINSVIKNIDQILFEELGINKTSVEKKMYIELLLEKS